MAPLLEAYRAVRREWRTAAKDLEERTTKRRELAMRADQLTFALEEIDAELMGWLREAYLFSAEKDRHRRKGR